ncbi:NYN domain-containing protein [Pilimelia columellifera]|uniref:NYN domain-containing protein n=1 Tax=Pilimelia columellifera subsp. columellifera TaxID=706583 RepID=A0ABP6AKI7_9ACTN
MFLAQPDPSTPHPVAGDAGLDLPEPVRQRIVTLVAAILPQLADDLPAPLRRVAKFAPNRRARLGGAAIATQLAADAVFRALAAGKVADGAGELAEAVRAGSAPADADVADTAALAYLLRPEGWRAIVEAASETVRASVDAAESAAAIRQAEQRVARAEHERAQARTEADKLRDDLARAREELSGLREEHRRVSKELRDALTAGRRSAELLATERGRAARSAADHDAELRRLRSKLAEAESVASGARQSARHARAVDEARLWLLLETIGQAAVGLRRELALDPADQLPADFVAAEHAQVPSGPEASPRARDTDDPARLDQLLALPKAHLVVDGYNVTKRGFGDISLEHQRNRLITGLGGIAAQTRVEVTVVFDGADKVPGMAPPPRGVRVLFSRKGESADDLIRQLARAEPPGRAVVVVSSDREVADGVRRHGAYPVNADSLLRRLARA